MVTVAVCGGPDWTAEDLTLVHNSKFFMFFNECEAISTATGLTDDEDMTLEQAIHILKAKIGDARLVVTRGAEGAVLLNGQPELHCSRIGMVDQKDTTGAGDFLIAVTAINAAMGASDAESLDFGVAAVAAELTLR